MCGIVAGIVPSKNQIQNTLLEGLKRLEYRGYDSAGMAWIDDQLNVVKSLGKVANLAAKLEHPSSAHIGIAHTRWATHGLPTQDNAHPHVSHGTLALVHNGIIENHQELRDQLEKDGYIFQSNTDSEVIVHLIHKMHQHYPMKQAIQQTIKQLEGSFAFVVLNLTSPNELYAATHRMPLVLGLSDQGHWLASDVMAIAPMCHSFAFFNEDTLIHLTPDAWHTLHHDGRLMSITPKQTHIQQQSLKLDTHKHFMHQEIYEQEHLLPYQVSQTITPATSMHETLFQDIDYIHIIACGSSYHAGLVAQYWFERQRSIVTQVSTASEFRYKKPVITAKTLIIAISQSGETADTIAAMTLAKQQTQRTVVITNVLTSTLATMSAHVLPCMAGTEQSVAATKSFSSQLIALAHLAMGTSSPINQNLLGPSIASILALEPQIAAMAKHIESFKHAFFIGRDLLFPVALEGSLKLKEISYIHAEAYAAGELKHGPLALIDPKCPTIALIHTQCHPEKMLSNIEEILARRGPVFVFHDQATTFQHKDIFSITLPDCDETLLPIIYSIALQLLAYHVALLKGLDIDQPRNLAKCVTVE